MAPDLVRLLRDHDIQPSAQRVAVAEFVLASHDHPTADEVLKGVRARFPLISRATIYNTLNTLVEKGLLRQLDFDGRVVFDCNVSRHHHFLDEKTGKIFDVPWDALEVKRVESLRGLEVRDYMVVLRGRKR